VEGPQKRAGKAQQIDALEAPIVAPVIFPLYVRHRKMSEKKISLLIVVFIAEIVFVTKAKHQI
jgi:hypothetical protein